ncbi:MAG: GCN5-related N-acetyltransferase [Bryobacterales bacterium]|nr:GCN5-related N-acetyltransferase [Bryobacterales bacterium]
MPTRKRVIRSLTPKGNWLRPDVRLPDEMRRANCSDLPLLVSLMAEFYAEAGYPLNDEAAAGAFAAIISDERLGYIWVIQEQHKDVGHLVVCLRFAMEFGGMIACLDDLYVQPASRNKGLGSAALTELSRFCATTGIRAMTVEVGHDNAAAQAVYRRAGFGETAGRQLLVLGLATPAYTV